MLSESPALFWFRRDLRIDDNTALFSALKNHSRVFCIFVFDRNILDTLPNKTDRRVEFIWHSIKELKNTLLAQGSDLLVVHGHPECLIANIAQTLKVSHVYTNHDYEPSAISRDNTILKQLTELNIGLKTYKDQVIFEKKEILTQSGGVFSVFTPYKNAWLKQLKLSDLQKYETLSVSPHLTRPKENEKIALRQTLGHDPTQLPSLGSMGFNPSNLLDLKIIPGASGATTLFEDFLKRIDHYKNKRDFPAIKGVSYLSMHMRFGTISVRKVAQHAWSMYQNQHSQGALSWLNELIWRDFYFQILYNHPYVVEKAFKPEYNHIEWNTSETAHDLFQVWCAGQTGYPLVDAAMRQLNHTGWMHNRLRMVVASFLIKDLGINWQWGEKYFADHLNDFDLSANNGGWQWAASSGCDAQPYFRIFNPINQSEKFDSEGTFIKRYCPELSKLNKKWIHSPWLAPAIELQVADVKLGLNYPNPCIDHAIARTQTLNRYAIVKKQKNRIKT